MVKIELNKGATVFGFIIISGFLLLWIITSIIPGLGIMGELIFRYMVGIKLLDYKWPIGSWYNPWIWMKVIWKFITTLPSFLYAISRYLINIIPILGPIINFIHLWSIGSF